MSDCEFCQEIRGERARFRKIYGTELKSRFVLQTKRFVAMPTLGQIFEGSMLVLPIDHVETCAALDGDAQAELLSLVDKVTARVGSFGHPIHFEHGSTRKTGGSCGIYHAHLHVVPLPSRVEPKELFPEALDSQSSLASAFAASAATDHYLLLGDSSSTLTRDLRKQPGTFPSQFFRQRLVTYFNLDRPWDWRAYSQAEPALLRILEGAHHAA